MRSTQNMGDMRGDMPGTGRHCCVRDAFSRHAAKFRALVTLAQARNQYERLTPPPTNEDPVSNARANSQSLGERSDWRDDFSFPELSFGMFSNDHEEYRLLPDRTSSAATVAHDQGFLWPSNEGMASSYYEQTPSMAQGWNGDCASVPSSPMTEYMASSSRAGSATGWNGELESPAGLRGDAESSQVPLADSDLLDCLLGPNLDPRSSDASPAAQSRSSRLGRPEAENNASRESCSEWLDRNWKSEVANFNDKVEKIAKEYEEELIRDRKKQLDTKNGVDSIAQTIRKVCQNVKPLQEVLNLVYNILIVDKTGAGIPGMLIGFRDQINMVYQSALHALNNLMSLDTKQISTRLNGAYKILEKDIVTHAFQKYVSAVTGQLGNFLDEQKPSSVSLLYRTLTTYSRDPNSLFSFEAA